MADKEDVSSLGEEPSIMEDEEDDEDELDFDLEEEEEGAEQDSLRNPAGHIPRAQLSSLEAFGQLDLWHSKLFPVEADLITELDAKTLFFVNAESLIVDAVLSKEINFDDETQFLHLTYRIERMLDGIRACGGVYRMVFFDCTQKLFSAAFGEAVWAFRQAFLTHCRIEGIDVAVFNNWYEPEWKAHVKAWRPAFTLIASNTIELEEEDEDEEPDPERPMYKAFFHALMLGMLATRHHVALLHGLQRRGNRIMCFTLEPDCYHAFIDQNVKAVLQPVLEAKDEDEEEDDEDEEKEVVSVALKEFTEKMGAKVDTTAVLRAFLVTRFGAKTLEMCDGQNPETVELMQLLIKVLLLHELLLQQIPLQHRAFAIPAKEDWELYSGSIAAAIDRYFTSVSEDLGELLKEAELPEKAKLGSIADLFDGRLYRHVFHAVVERGLDESCKGKVEEDFFGLQPWLKEQVEALWKESGSSTPFFPISIVALIEKVPGLTPPPMPRREAPRQKPKLQKIESEFVDCLFKDMTFKNIEEVDREEEDDATFNVLEGHGWKKGVNIDSAKHLETMEDNEAQAAFKAKMALRKQTAREVDYQRKFDLKKRQMALRALHAYSRSLTGSDKMHAPIIMKEEKDGKALEKEKKEEKKKGEEKLSAKHKEILEKSIAEKDQKMKEADKNFQKKWEAEIDALEKLIDPPKLEKDLLDLVLGFQRMTDSFVGFPQVSANLKTEEARTKVAVKLVKAVYKSMKKMRLDKLPADQQPQARKLVCYLCSLVQEACTYTKNSLDGSGIKTFQEVLVSIGFPLTADKIFEDWKARQAAAKAKLEAPAEEDKKGKKDDKKDKKDDKKDKKDKKDDKKDKKDKKDDAEDEEDPDKYYLKKKKDVDVIWSGVTADGSDEYAFQLKHLGPYMTRTTGTAKDEKERVLFKPDQWQKDLLDIVDSDKSSLVVAPTASGKTFICYYVMQKVLRMDNDSVAIYVAPSKALVNQVSAEIYARFGSKVYPAHSPNQLLGVFIKEYNSAGGEAIAGKWRNCQVLVTIPHVLEMLLLSPEHQDWVKRLKYIVFDEVHCIGEQEGGLQWEHVLQLIPCPFLALSATVADPRFFLDWLTRVCTKKQQSEVVLVKHTERWNDLYKYMFVEGGLRPLHPFCCLLEKTVERNGISSDMSLTPEEMMQLHFEITRQLKDASADKEALEMWAELSPNKYFVGHSFLKKKEAREYEVKLKDAFLKLLADGALNEESFKKMTMALQSTMPLTLGMSADALKAAESSTVNLMKLAKSNSYLQPASIHQLCKTLDKNGYLPGIIFNFDRAEIQTMLNGLVKELKDQQWNKYYGTEDRLYSTRQIMNKRTADYQAKLKQYEEAQKMKASGKQEGKASAADGEKRSKEAVDNSADAAMEAPIEPTDIADEIDMDFTFHSPKALGQWQEDIDEMIGKLWLPGEEFLVDGLRRGIGMHHEGCKKPYKDAVEILFRRGYLRVVFATGTLALGINMPCRSTVFCGDSLELNGLMYRQMSGRAGRRGFDLLGQVIFWDMGFNKIQRLVSSELPNLSGEFSCSSTAVLRVLRQWEVLKQKQEKFDDDVANDKKIHDRDRFMLKSKEELARCLNPMFSAPFFRSDKADLETQVRYHARFSLELLCREGLVDANGNSKNLAGLASHLFDSEPANFLMARVLASGALHSYLKSETKKVKKGDRSTSVTVKLTAVLAALIFRKRLPDIRPREKIARKLCRPSAGCPALPPLPPKIQKVVEEYSDGMFNLFQEFAWTVASARKPAAVDLTLPITGRVSRENWDERGEPFAEESSFQKAYLGQLIRPRARSPFVAISGLSDVFQSEGDLVNSLRPVIHLDDQAVPLISTQPANSWMLDFMIHGKKKYLEIDNGINATEAWKVITGFQDAVKQLTVVMAVYCPKEDIVLTTAQQLNREIDIFLNPQKHKSTAKTAKTGKVAKE